jgi:putative addiction module killer protein
VEVREYLTADGENPYRQWLDTLDVTPHARIQARVLRFSMGNLGDHKSLGGRRLGISRDVRAGVPDLLGKDGQQLVLLLLGGDKSTQASDVARAQASWKAYQEDKRRGKTK